MKQKYLYILSVAAVLLATACTDDMGIQELPVESGKGYTVRAGATMNPSSRMTIENDGTVVDYYWTADDSFTVFDTQHDQQTEFVLDKETFEANSEKADFVGTPGTAYQNGQKLYAIYNKKEPVSLDANGNVNFDLSNQNGQLNEKFQYMWGDATYKEGKPLEFVFRHLVTTLQVKVPVPAGVETLKDVTLVSHNLVSQATLVLNEAPYDTEKQFGVGDLVYSYNESGDFNFGSITLDGEFAVEDGYATFYIYTLSAKQYYESSTWYNQAITPFVLFTDNTGKQHVTVDLLLEKEMEVGAVYSLEYKNAIPLVDFANEDQVKGSANAPYQIANTDQMYSLMMRSYLEMKNENGILYKKRSYQLTNDIVLDARAIWYPIRLDNADFDGNGKTISGKMDLYVASPDNGLFGCISHGTLKDLTLDTDMNLVYHDGLLHHAENGTLVGELWWSTLRNCFSSARMQCNGTICGILGGLVGNAGMSTIEYCGFSGEIDNSFAFESIGGLVGCNNSSSDRDYLTINGCYSTGSIKVDNNGTGDFGGIIGYYVDSNATITNCWSNISLSSYNATEPIVGNLGGIVGVAHPSTSYVAHCYWNKAISSWVGYETSVVPVDCAFFEGAIPTSAQLKELSYGIISSGMVFSEENGKLVKNNQTGVPPSDIENW